MIDKNIYEVQFYSIFTKKHVTFSRHNNIDTAVKKAKKLHSNGQERVTILINNRTRVGLDKRDIEGIIMGELT